MPAYLTNRAYGALFGVPGRKNRRAQRPRLPAINVSSNNASVLICRVASSASKLSMPAVVRPVTAHARQRGVARQVTLEGDFTEARPTTLAVLLRHAQFRARHTGGIDGGDGGGDQRRVVAA